MVDADPDFEDALLGDDNDPEVQQAEYDQQYPELYDIMFYER